MAKAEAKKPWKPSAGAIKYQRMKHRHEMELAVINAFAKDPELKYYLGIAAGAGITAITALLGQYLPEGVGEEPSDKNAAYNAKKQLLDQSFAGWMVIAGGPAAVLAANPSILNALNPSASSGTSDTPWSGLNSLIGMAGVSFAGFCASYLLLKAVFGEQGIRKLTGAINDIVPG